MGCVTRSTRARRYRGDGGGKGERATTFRTQGQAALEPIEGGGHVKKHLMLVALVSALALVAASCGGDEEGGETGPTGPTAETGAGVTQGGVVREELTDFGFTGAFDPTGEYLGTAWSWYQQML